VWSRYHRRGFYCVLVREKEPGGPEHFHALIHVPPDKASKFYKTVQGWFSAMDDVDIRPAHQRVTAMRGGKRRSAIGYLTKQRTPQAAWKSPYRREPGDPVLGKRARISNTLRSYVMSMTPTPGEISGPSALSTIPVDPVGGCLMVAKTKCPGCGEAVSHDLEHGRAVRRKTYCTTRCRRRAERTRTWNARSTIAARAAIMSGRKAPSNSLKLLADNSGKSRSRVGFWHGDSAFDAKLWRLIVKVEQFDRQWRPTTSSDGVVSEGSVLRPRAPPG
jgi:hypothetical protein